MTSSSKKPVVGLVAGLTLEDASACNDILGRLKQISNAKSDTGLAKALGLKQSSISTAKARGMVPSSWIVNASNLFNVSADWLIYGDEKFPEKAPGKTRRAPASAERLETEINPDYNKMADEWALDLTLDEFEHLWERFKAEREWRRGWLQVEMTKRFPEFGEWLKSQPRPISAPSPAAIKLAAQTRRYGRPDQLDDD
ncbi:MAG: helix-turn-helix domain containing protein [Candidatus Adiutrix sp.]|jgi:hypothetical protein|nr:helix-turn-helix domain containing protein [Candidatus Adiutrix sp.]